MGGGSNVAAARGLLQRLFFFLLLLLLHTTNTASGYRDGRYSYSLTTFDPSGTLGPVQRAQQAAARGTPLVALIYSIHNTNNTTNTTATTNTTTTTETGILLAAPQVLPDCFTLDDGTARFALISPALLLAHTGVAADGRVLVAQAQRWARQHAYTFDDDPEKMDVRLFLEEVSLRMQEYTVKPAVRPWGVRLLVAHLPSDPTVPPALYQVDPSGHVAAVSGKVAVLNVRDPRRETALREALQQEMVEQPLPSSMEEARARVVQVLRAALRPTTHAAAATEEEDDGLIILTAGLARREGTSASTVFWRDCHAPDAVEPL